MQPRKTACIRVRFQLVTVHGFYAQVQNSCRLLQAHIMQQGYHDLMFMSIKHQPPVVHLPCTSTQSHNEFTRCCLEEQTASPLLSRA